MLIAVYDHQKVFISYIQQHIGNLLTKKLDFSLLFVWKEKSEPHVWAGSFLPVHVIMVYLCKLHM